MKVAVITGASSGLGKALANLLVQQGYSLVLGDKNKVEQKRVVAELGKHSSVIAVVMDVRKKKDCERLISTAIKKFGHLDLLINNAGVWRMATIDEVTEEDIQNMFATNVFGPMYCVQAAVAVMKKQGHGHILNIGSTAAVDYKTSHIAYGSSKAALIGFTAALRAELEGTGIRVSVFSPGGMKTNLFRSKPGKIREDFMDPAFVAEKILEHIENPKDEWHVILRRVSR